MRGEILLKFLEILKEQAISQVDFIEAVLTSGYGAGVGKINFEYQKNQQKSYSRKVEMNTLEERKKRLRVFISKMKHDGLIREVGENDTKLFISSRGNAKLLTLKNKLPDRNYEKEKQIYPIIVSFDIPEKLRRKRNWLREVLKNLDFEMIHQSVWVGKTKIPKAMILDLENLKILEYVEIFEVGKTGTLKKLGK